MKLSGNLVILNHKLRNFTGEVAFTKAINYFNDEKKVDSTLLNNIPHTNELENEGYVIREGSTGAFDTFGDKSVKQIKDEYRKYKPSKIWTNIISIKKEDAEKLGLIDKTDFVRYTERIVMYMAKELDINPSNLIWTGFLHIDTPTHPNVHFYLFDKSRPHCKKLLTKNQIYKLKQKAIADLINRNPLYVQKENVKVTLQDKIKQTLANEKVDKISWKGRLSIEFQKKFYELAQSLPRSGRLSYNSFQLREYKTVIDECVHSILNTGENKVLYKQLLNILDDLVEANKDIYGNVDGNTSEQYKTNQIERLYTIIGNAILSEVKDYRSNYLVPQKSISQEKRKEILYVNRRIKRYNSRNCLKSGKITLTKGIKKMSNYYANKARNDMLYYAQKEIKAKEIEEQEFE